jgi:ribosomal protein L40E
MAIITCQECGASISDQAGKCPKCGYPIKRLRQSIQKITESEWATLNQKYYMDCSPSNLFSEHYVRCVGCGTYYVINKCSNYGGTFFLNRVTGPVRFNSYIVCNKCGFNTQSYTCMKCNTINRYPGRSGEIFFPKNKSFLKRMFD